MDRNGQFLATLLGKEKTAELGALCLTNQLGRRNLDPEQVKYYLGKKYNLEG